jgi:hypothetical protein
MDRGHPFVFKIESDPLRALRYRWTVCEGSQIHIRSPQSYASSKEAESEATDAMQKLGEAWPRTPRWRP